MYALFISINLSSVKEPTLDFVGFGMVHFPLTFPSPPLAHPSFSIWFEYRYVGVLKKFSSLIEGSIIEGKMDPAVVGKFKMTPLVSSMASDLKKAAEANDSVSAVLVLDIHPASAPC